MASVDVLRVQRDRFQLLDAGVAVGKLKMGGAQWSLGEKTQNYSYGLAVLCSTANQMSTDGSNEDLCGWRAQ